MALNAGIPINCGSGSLQLRTKFPLCSGYTIGSKVMACVDLAVHRKRGLLLHILCNCKVTMQEEKEWGQGRITWRHDSVLFSMFRILYSALLCCKKEHRQVKLGVSKQDVRKIVQFKTESNVKYLAVSVPLRNDILEEAAGWEVQFDMTAPE